MQTKQRRAVPVSFRERRCPVVASCDLTAPMSFLRDAPAPFELPRQDLIVGLAAADGKPGAAVVRTKGVDGLGGDVGAQGVQRAAVLGLDGGALAGVVLSPHLVGDEKRQHRGYATGHRHQGLDLALVDACPGQQRADPPIRGQRQAGEQGEQQSEPGLLRRAWAGVGPGAEPWFGHQGIRAEGIGFAAPRRAGRRHFESTTQHKVLSGSQPVGWMVLSGTRAAICGTTWRDPVPTPSPVGGDSEARGV